MSNIKSLVNQITTEAYTPGYPIPNSDDQAYILLQLSLGVAKRNAIELNHVGQIPEGPERHMINVGVSLMKGKISPEGYLKSFQGFINKLVGKKVHLPDIAKSQIIARVKNSSPSSRMLKQESVEPQAKGMYELPTAWNSEDVDKSKVWQETEGQVKTPYYWHHNTETNCYSVEVSDLQSNEGHRQKFTDHLNPKTGIKFKSGELSLVSIDKDGSDEDIYGWNYKDKEGTKFLFIND